jgi:hypothetical protein
MNFLIKINETTLKINKEHDIYISYKKRSWSIWKI